VGVTSGVAVSVGSTVISGVTVSVGDGVGDGVGVGVGDGEGVGAAVGVSVGLTLGSSVVDPRYSHPVEIDNNDIIRSMIITLLACIKYVLKTKIFMIFYHIYPKYATSTK